MIAAVLKAMLNGDVHLVTGEQLKAAGRFIVALDAVQSRLRGINERAGETGEYPTAEAIVDELMALCRTAYPTTRLNTESGS